MSENKFIAGINSKIQKIVSEYAEEHGISYEEAAKRAYLVIDGKKIEPIEANELEFSFDPKKEET